jgi:L-cysteine:1D-myo-inositol 2-amino-2-deoxy-alpha-D-glucopyranoside ligase
MLRLFNTMTQSVEPFTAPEGSVRLYVCGVTPYDTAHLGHAFVYASFDVLVRLLRVHGLEVDYTQNVTDIDDPLFEKARALGNITWDELARRETDRFVQEMQAINVAPPHHFVRASDELPAMFTLIEQLLANGHAYRQEGWIYFDHTTDPTYGQLAEAAGFRGYDALLAEANEHGNDPTDPRKRDPLDFLLWRGSGPDEPSWASPWGPGRPGWHIECSAMATRYLGPQLDIHGGGRDLIFPHHSSEIAQSENASGKRPYVRFWMHVGMVALDGIKMSKSLGNLVIINQLLRDYTPDAVRVMLAGHHYRASWEFFLAEMAAAQTIADRLTAAVSDAPALPDDLSGIALLPEAQPILAALENDLDTPAALTALAALAQQLTEATTLTDAERGRLQQALCFGGGLLGLRLGSA